MPPDNPHNGAAGFRRGGSDEEAGRSSAGVAGRWRAVRVWDLPTRLFHWLLVVLVAAAYLTWRANWMDWHALCGDAVLALVLFRLAWGFAGSDTARFSQFLAAPGAAASHLAHLFRREPDTQCGHNPAGGWMVLLLLLLLLGQALSGVVVNNDVADDGPLTPVMPVWLANLVTALHVYLWQALLAAIVLHLAAILAYAVLKGHNLLRPMITGMKFLPAERRPPRIARVALACLVFFISAAAAALIAGMA